MSPLQSASSPAAQAPCRRVCEKLRERARCGSENSAEWALLPPFLSFLFIKADKRGEEIREEPAQDRRRLGTAAIYSPVHFQTSKHLS